MSSGTEARTRVKVPGAGVWLAVVLAVGALPAVPGPAAAQWVEEPGEGWIDVSIYHQDTREQFGIDGDKEPIFADGHSIATAVFFTVVTGVYRGVDVWAQVPWQRLDFDDAGGDRLRSGIGDSRFYLRVKPTEYLEGVDLPLAIRGGVKLPLGDFDVNSEVIPLGDGQRDWELMAELGHSFHPFPAYVNGWVGYRWRELNEESLQDWGDEVFFLAQAGVDIDSFGLQLVVEGWDGRTPVIERIRVPNAARSMLQVTSTLNYEIGPGTVRGGARVPVTGTNLAAGTTAVAGYFLNWSF